MSESSYPGISGEIEDNQKEEELLTTHADVGFERVDCLPAHKAVEIIVRDDRHGYRIDKQAFQEIFNHPNVANIPVAIYSISGRSRTGKSFMLNLFLRFLWAEKSNASQSWVQSQKIKLDEGFGWSDGMRHHTEGIWIWDEPFFVSTSHHGLVALFLMDTQGGFDALSSVKDNAMVFALSTLISSMQIYNTRQMIQEDTLQHLHLFTEYARMAQKVLKHDNNSFQELLFLIRDFPYVEIPLGFDGGDKYLQKIFRVHVDHLDIKSVRKNLLDSFENVSCFIMPFPGNKIAERHRENIHLDLSSDLHDNFKEMVEVLARRIFHPDQLVVKQFNNKPVKGNDLINFVSEYADVFSSEKMPKIGTSVQATATADILNIVQECKDEYRQEMKRLCKNAFKSDEEFINIHYKCKEKVLLSFEVKPKFGNDAFHKMYFEKLQDFVENEFQEYKKINGAEKEQMKLKAHASTFAAEQMYTKNLEELSSGQHVDENSVHKIEGSFRKTAVNLYFQETHQYPREIVKKYKGKLERRLDEALKQFKEKNHHKGENLRRQLDGKWTCAIQQYRSSMEEICGTGSTDAEIIKQTHSNAKEQAETLVLSVDHSKGSELVGKYISRLDEFLNNELKLCRRRIENLKIHFSSKLAKIDAVSLSTSTDIVDYIGCGGFGAIRRCYHESLGTVVAKCISLTGEVNQIYSHKKSVQGEAETLVRVQHPNIVKIYGFTSWNNEIAIILEFIGGGNLSRYLEKHREKHPSWKLRLRFALQLISALSYLHNYKSGQIFCHGDIKPDNILLTTRLCIKLSDFGANNVIRASGMKHSTIDTTITRQYSLLYVSPEFYKGGSVDPASDIYSFGMVLYEIVTLNPIFYGRTLSEEILMARISSGVRPDETHVNNVKSTLAGDEKHIFNILTDFMRKCWNGDPYVRPKAEQIFQDLSQVSTTDHDETNVADNVLAVQPQSSSKMGNLSQFTAPFMVATLNSSV